MENLFLVGQIVLGLYFVMAGLMHFMKMKDMVGYAKMKKLPMPEVAVGLSGLVMVLGGAGILFQTSLVFAYWALIAFLVLSAFLMHNFWTQNDPQAKMMDMVNFQKNLALAAALLILLTQLS
ncbi:DoxX family membrane protein [Candidatus Uhrbacteria bacterium]|nr:DoxX family membrane protein [Candidatus Uhrbacteria bacterium]